MLIAPKKALTNMDLEKDSMNPNQIHFQGKELKGLLERNHMDPYQGLIGEAGTELILEEILEDSVVGGEEGEESRRPLVKGELTNRGNIVKTVMREELNQCQNRILQDHL